MVDASSSGAGGIGLSSIGTRRASSVDVGMSTVAPSGGLYTAASIATDPAMVVAYAVASDLQYHRGSTITTMAASAPTGDPAVVESWVDDLSADSTALAVTEVRDDGRLVPSPTEVPVRRIPLSMNSAVQAMQATVVAANSFGINIQQAMARMDELLASMPVQQAAEHVSAAIEQDEESDTDNT